MKKIKFVRILTALIGICSCATNASASGLLGLDAFLPANESYTYNEEYGIITSFCGGVGSSTCAGIYVNGKVWDPSTNSLSSKPVYTFKEWASTCTNYTRGDGITGLNSSGSADTWIKPENALGKATAGNTWDVVVLGDNGSITLGFEKAICNGSGYDFAVFENALNDTFLEFAFVLVSTDSEHFVSFPTFYLGTEPVGSDITAGDNDPTLAYNLGCKYRIGYGNGYDLQEIANVYEYICDHYDFENQVASSSCIFSLEFIQDFLENYKYIDLNEINYVKIVDIVGDGNTLDSSGSPILDAYPTTGTPGFDLSGVGVLNCLPEPSDFALASAFLCIVFLTYSRNRKTSKR